MDLPQRMPNRIPDYDYNQSGAYFVTICTQDRKQILSHIVGGGAHDAPDVQESRFLNGFADRIPSRNLAKRMRYVFNKAKS
jgi:hypothetical protein